MTNETQTIPPDDLQRKLALARPNEDQKLPHVGLAGDTYTILLTGKDTAGRYCLIDMLVPPGGGPPPHRHDFQEMFTLLDGEIEVTFRGANGHPLCVRVLRSSNLSTSSNARSRWPSLILFSLGGRTPCNFRGAFFTLPNCRIGHPSSGTV